MRSLMSGFSALVATAALLGLTAAPAAARVIVKESTRYYTVGGVDGAQIYREMGRKGPKIRGRKGPFIAKTDLGFDFKRLEGDVRGNRCVVTNVDVILTVGYTMPKWSAPKRSSPAMARAWKRYQDYVWAHERKHAQIGKDAAAEMHSAIRAITGSARKDCSDLAGKIDAPFARIIKKHNRRQQQLDASPFGVGGNATHYDYGLQAAK